MASVTKLPVLSDVEADATRARLARTALRDGGPYMPIAESLYRLWFDDRHVKRWGFPSWTAWAATELPMGLRMANYMRLIFMWFRVDHPLPQKLDARLQRLEWTKARLLVRKVTSMNAEEVIGLAERSTRRELETALKTSAVAPPSPSTSESERFRLVRFHLADDRADAVSPYAVFSQAVAAAKAISGSDNLGHNVSLIAQDFLAGVGGRGRSIAAYLRGLEAMLGLRLVAIDTQRADIVYGADVLRTLAAHGRLRFDSRLPASPNARESP